MMRGTRMGIVRVNGWVFVTLLGVGVLGLGAPRTTRAGEIQRKPAAPPVQPRRPYAYIGVSMGPVTGGLADRYQLPQDRRTGVLVNQVMPDSPAQKAGLRTGDIIHSVDGHPVTRPDELLEAVAFRPIGAEVALDLTRPRPGFKGSDPQQVRMTLAERTDGVEVQDTLERMRNPPAGGPPEAILADPLSIAGLNLGRVSQDSGLKGLRVFSVVPNSEAAMGGFFQGDLILKINGTEVTSRAEVLEVLGAAPVDQPLLVTLERDGKAREIRWSVPLPLPTPTPGPSPSPSPYDPTNGTVSYSGGNWRVKQ